MRFQPDSKGISDGEASRVEVVLVEEVDVVDVDVVDDTVILNEKTSCWDWFSTSVRDCCDPL